MDSLFVIRVCPHVTGPISDDFDRYRHAACSGKNLRKEAELPSWPDLVNKASAGDDLFGGCASSWGCALCLVVFWAFFVESPLQQTGHHP